MRRLQIDRVIYKKVAINDRALISINTIIMPEVEIGEDSVVLPGSAVTMDTHISKNEIWGGAPAKKIKDKDGE